jgi:nucleoid DNA-binding protein
MNEKINLQDLAALLAEKVGITKKEAEIFLRECSDVMNEGLVNDKLLKIKNLGIFKLIQVGNRESVDVATGERVLIPAHYKVSFSADKNLAQTVNEPFAFFETVEIKDDAIVDETENIAEPEEEIAENVAEPAPEEEITESVAGQESEIVDIVVEPEKIEPEKIDSTVDKENDAAYENVNRVIFEDIEVKKPAKKKNRFILFLILLIWCLLVAGIFWYTAMENKSQQMIAIPMSMPEIKIEKTDSIVVIAVDTTAIDSTAIDSTVINSTVIDSIAIDSTVIKSPGIEEKTETKTAPVVKKEASVNKKRTITRGERLTLIALEEYGHKLFWIYLYEENKSFIKNPEIVLPGLAIWIPPASKYDIDKNNPKSIDKAQALIDSYKRRR